jgi:hypothetical protein
MTTSGSATPGWYPDPYDPANLRYWDGLTWTESIAPGVAGAPPVAGASSGLGDIGSWLGDTFKVLFARIVPIALLLYVIPTVGLAALMVEGRSVLVGMRYDRLAGELQGFNPSDLVLVGVIGALLVLVSAVCWLAATHQLYFSHIGQPPSLGASLAAGVRRLPQAIGWGLVLAVLIALVMAVALGLPIVLAATVSNQFLILFVVMIPLLIAGGIWIGIKLYYFGTVVVVGPRGANPIATSFSLSAGRWWATLGRALLLWIVIYGVSIAGQLIFNVAPQVILAGSLQFNSITGEIQVDGQDISTLDVIDFGRFVPSVPVLVVLAVLYGFNQALGQALGISGGTALYRRAGGPAGEGA